METIMIRLYKEIDPVLPHNQTRFCSDDNSVSRLNVWNALTPPPPRGRMGLMSDRRHCVYHHTKSMKQRRQLWPLPLVRELQRVVMTMMLLMMHYHCHRHWDIATQTVTASSIALAWRELRIIINIELSTRAIFEVDDDVVLHSVWWW